uniref:CCA tRNA nucleotidyltransferase 1, mitochondrial n=1 Tax=Lygus hesperus TaxID=30085 RepID=A0A0A9Y0H3_LYGHE
MLLYLTRSSLPTFHQGRPAVSKLLQVFSSRCLSHQRVNHSSQDVPRRKPFIMKVDSPEFHSLFTPSLKTLIDVFAKHEYEIRIAGGAVRDILSGKIPKDVDFATTATPDQMKEMLSNEQIRMINMKGEKHGTITARINNDNFEVTTLRLDVTTDGRHAEVQFTKDWELDANRRDLTINSMFLGTDGTVYDYFGGYEDLKAKRVAFVGDPNKRIQEDYLRILRYFRFYARIVQDPDKHEAETINAISSNIGGLEQITGERIWMELSKILSGNFVSQVVTKLIEVGASKYIGLPEDPNVGEFRAVCKRTEGLNPQPITLLVGLLKSEEEMMNLHARLKLSSLERDLGRFITAYRSEEPFELKKFQAMMLKRDGKLSDTRLFIMELFKYTTKLAFLQEFETWEPPKFPINGNILKENNVPAGKPLGKVLTALKESWVDSDYQKTLDDLLKELPDLMSKLKIVPTERKNV